MFFEAGCDIPGKAKSASRLGSSYQRLHTKLTCGFCESIHSLPICPDTFFPADRYKGGCNIVDPPFCHQEIELCCGIPGVENFHPHS